MLRSSARDARMLGSATGGVPQDDPAVRRATTERRTAFTVGHDRCVTSRIDTSFDFRSDTPAGRDPDTFSPTLAQYHQRLWSRSLPNVSRLDLTPSPPPIYLHHRSPSGDLWLSSDSVIHTYMTWPMMQPIVERMPASDSEAFRAIASTIGGMMVWPANRVGGAMTINGARGFTRSIRDRFDLTVECVRRYYLGIVSPLEMVLARYPEFFALFVDFDGFVEFFLLQDLVTDARSAVTCFLPFDDFSSPALPQDLPTYLSYRARSIDFVAARNERIGQLDEALSADAATLRPPPS